jgi:hypothetical protein
MSASYRRACLTTANAGSAAIRADLESPVRWQTDVAHQLSDHNQLASAMLLLGSRALEVGDLWAVTDT